MVRDFQLCPLENFEEWPEILWILQKDVQLKICTVHVCTASRLWNGWATYGGELFGGLQQLYFCIWPGRASQWISKTSAGLYQFSLNIMQHLETVDIDNWYVVEQTGSGKTHTMWGVMPDTEEAPCEDRGITPRVFERLFARIQQVTSVLHY